MEPFEELLEALRADVAALRAETEREHDEIEPVRELWSNEPQPDVDAKSWRRGSRYIGPNGSRDLAERLAAGDEIKIARPQARRRGGHASLGGVFTKALAEGTGSSGGYLVPLEVASEVMSMLRAKSVVMRMGPTTVPVRRELAVTAISSGATAYYVTENSAIPVSEQTFTQMPLLIPKELAALVPVSNRLLADASLSPALDQVLKQDLAEVLALRQDLAFIQGAGTGGEPLGLVNVSGLTAGPSLGANGRTPTFDDLKATVAALRMQNAPFNKPGWVFNPRLLATLELMKDSTGRYLADSDLLTFDRTGGGGTLLGHPFATTTQIATNLTTGSSSDTTFIVFSSDWNELWVGENESLTIEASNEATYSADGGQTYVSAWQTRQTVFRAVAVHDVAPRRPQLFTVVGGVRP